MSAKVEERHRKLAEQIVLEGPPKGHPWWTENDSQRAAELEIEWAAQLLADAMQQARLEELEYVPHYPGCATLLATRDPYPPCDCWVGQRIAALKAEVKP